MAKNNVPVTLTENTTVEVDGEEVELAAGTELSRELAEKLGVVGGKKSTRAKSSKS
jgi:hypothetical protein